jgi:hypothetical protein
MNGLISYNGHYVKEASQGNILFPFGEIRHNAGGKRYRCEGGAFSPRTCYTLFVRWGLSYAFIAHPTALDGKYMGNSNSIKAHIVPFAGIRQKSGGTRYRCEGRRFSPRACWTKCGWYPVPLRGGRFSPRACSKYPQHRIDTF